VTRPPEFTASLRLRDGVALVMLAGEADLYSAALLHDVLQQAVATGAPSVVVDTALLSFCDAHGLGLLVAAGNDLREAGRHLSVRAAPLVYAGSCRSPGSPRR
jgi:anti-anti-sigma factor